MFSNVKHFMARGGSFICTFPSKTTILNRLMGNGKLLSGGPPVLTNELYRLEFAENYQNLNQNSFGQGYYF